MRTPHPALCLAVSLTLASCFSGGAETRAPATAAAAPREDGAPGLSAPRSRGDAVGRANSLFPLGAELASKSGELSPLAGGAIEAARRLATEGELRPPAPALLARPDGPDQKALPLEALRVATVLSATRARTLVDCTFRNPFDRVLQGTLMVRLPDGASPARLGMFQGTGLAVSPRAGGPSDAPPSSEAASVASFLLPPRLPSPEALLGADLPLSSSYTSGPLSVAWGELRPARVVGKDQGTEVYEAVTRRRIDPALLEWAGGDSFSARIFPIAARGRKRVFFVYDQPLLEVAGRATVALAVPRELPPAFRLETAAQGSAWREAQLVTSAGPEALEERPTPGWLRRETEMHATDRPAKGVEGAFLLSAAPRDTRVQAGLAEAPGIPGTLVHARLRPLVRERTDARTGEAAFLVDTSLSGRTRLAASFGKLLREILERDATIERFRVIAFDVRAHALTDGAVPNTPAAREAALRAIEARTLEGATSVEAAMAALDASLGGGPVAPGAPRPTVFLLSDAQATWGLDDARALEKRFPRLFALRWVGYRLGDAAVDRPLLSALTRAGGRIVEVPGVGDLAAAATAHRSLPLGLRDVRVEGAAALDVSVEGAPRALFPGQTLEVAVRLAPGADARAAEVVLETEAGPQRFPLAQAAPSDAAAARAWAEATARALLALETKEADRQALALSQRFGIVNRVASLLILETDAEYAQWKIEEAPLDLAACARAAREREAGRPAGAPDDAALDAKAHSFLDAIAGARPEAGRGAWRAASEGRDAIKERGGSPPARPTWGERVDPVQAWRAATARRAWARGAEDELSLRLLSSIVEEAPRDARALRLVAFTLMEWRAHEDAAALFARVRRQRPREPQALLCEAVALEALGRLDEAAHRLEIVLAGAFDQRWERFAKDGARRQYARLLDALPARLSEAASARRSALGLPKEAPRFEAALYWNLDDTDVDMHIERAGILGREVFYGNRTSGDGELLWDNTAGLGPEIYTDGARPPSEVFVHYFGTRSVEGTVPSATLLIVRGPEGTEARAAVLADARDKVTLWPAGAAPLE